MTQDGLTSVVFPDTLPVESGRQLLVTVRFLETAMIGGGLVDVPTEAPLPIEPQVDICEVYIIFFKIRGHTIFIDPLGDLTQRIYDTEWATMDAVDPSPNTLHILRYGILTTNDGDSYVFNN